MGYISRALPLLQGLRIRRVLWVGYAAIVLLLLFSGFEAYRIQQGAAQRSEEIYRRFAKQQDLLSQLRRNLLVGGLYARDFLLNPRRERNDTLKLQLQALKAEIDQQLDELDGIASLRPASAQLRPRTMEYWNTLEPMLHWTDEITFQRAFAFVEQEIRPRRDAASAVVRELLALSSKTLENAETDFAASRRAAIRRQLTILGLCVVVGVIVALASLAYAGALEAQSERQFRQMAESKRDLEMLSARVLDVQETERKQLSRELHDEVAGTLTALRIDISHALAGWKSGSPDVPDKLERAHALAERTIRAVRDISLLLRPSVLDDIGLGPALNWLAKDCARRTGMQCTVSEEDLQERLPENVKTCVYRVVQEALHNCEKHARASRVRVTVRQESEALTVEITDDGTGFEPEENGIPARSAGLGILGMRERAAGLGGTLVIESARGRGTHLLLSLPLAAENAAPDLGVLESSMSETRAAEV
jgi:signal transduction histidine kinase